MKIDKSKYDSKIIEISFLSDNLMLKGTLHLPSTNMPSVVIGSHGLYSTGNSPKQIALADACNCFGLAYFRFDHRGCGSSQGQFEKVTSLETRCRDLRSAIEVIRSRDDVGDRLGLFGSSMGGTVCLSIANEFDVSAIVTFAAPIRSNTPNKGIKRPDNPTANGIFFDAHKQAFDISDKLGKIKNILIFHGDADEIVPLSHAREIYKFAGVPKRLMIQRQGDHRMSNEEHQEAFIREASSWFNNGLISNFY